MKADRRFTFLDYNILRKVKLKSLDHLSERIYIVVGSEHDSIPVKLVKKIQRMKSDIRWIIANNNGSEHVDYHIAFLMGKLHSKVDRKIEFVVVSNDPNIDPMINCVIEYGRSCTLVQNKNRSLVKSSKSPKTAFATEEKTDEDKLPFGIANNTESLRDKTITETIRRLMYSSKPPTTIEDLRAYIELSNQESAKYIDLEDILEEMADRNVINIVEGKIIYNFLPAL